MRRAAARAQNGAERGRRRDPDERRPPLPVGDWRVRPPSDETIERLAAIFETDARELFQIAGRTPVDSHFEQQVLAELKAIRAELNNSAKRLDA